MRWISASVGKSASRPPTPSDRPPNRPAQDFFFSLRSLSFSRDQLIDIGISPPLPQPKEIF